MHRPLLALLTVLACLAGAPAARAAEPPAMLVIHGGAWQFNGAAVTATVRPVAERFAHQGFQSTLVDYARGADGFRDVVAAYDALAASGRRVCAYGESAGGHWALLLAAKRPALECVIAVAAPTDLTDPAAPYLRTAVEDRLPGLAATLSPVRYASAIRARVMLVTGADDLLVPSAQATAMNAALGGRASVFAVSPGTVPWMHGSASPEALANLQAAEAAFAAGVQPAGAVEAPPTARQTARPPAHRETEAAKDGRRRRPARNRVGGTAGRDHRRHGGRRAGGETSRRAGRRGGGQRRSDRRARQREAERRDARRAADRRAKQRAARRRAAQRAADRRARQRMADRRAAQRAAERRGA